MILNLGKFWIMPETTKLTHQYLANLCKTFNNETLQSWSCFLPCPVFSAPHPALTSGPPLQLRSLLSWCLVFFVTLQRNVYPVTRYSKLYVIKNFPFVIAWHTYHYQTWFFLLIVMFLDPSTLKNIEIVEAWYQLS